MTQEFINAIVDEIQSSAKEKRIDVETVKSFLIEAIKKIYQKKFDVKNLVLDIDLQKRTFKCEQEFEVVPEDDLNYDDFMQIPVNDPEIKKLKLKVGETYIRPFNIKESFTRGEVLQILQTFKQKMIEITNQQVYSSWKSKINQIVHAKVKEEDRRSGAYYIDLKDIDNVVETTGYLPRKEQNPRERLEPDLKYPFFIKEVTEQSKFWPVVLSRSSEEIVNYYMTLQIPEIEQDLIRITKIARAAGNKTKVLIKPNSKSILEPVAVCIGLKGSRIKAISNQIGQEKIEVFLDYEEPIKNLINLIGIDKILGLNITYDENKNVRSAIVFVKEEEVSVILGKYGVNIKLINKLLNILIDVKTLDYAKVNNIEYIPTSELPTLVQEHYASNIQINPVSEDNLENIDYSTDMEELMRYENQETLEEDTEEFINDLFNEDISKLINDENKK